MAAIFPASQFNKAFRPTRLQNWERPADDKESKTSVSAGTLKARSGKSHYIVDDRGHLLSSQKRRPAAFTHNPQPYQRSSAQWPQKNATIQTGGNATMGCKGVTKCYYFDDEGRLQQRFA